MRRVAPAWLAVASATAGFVACLIGWLSGGGSVDIAWAPTLGLRLDLAFDGLGALYGLLATGIGAAVFAYGAAYIPLHLAHDGRPEREAWRFWPWMVLFMAAMVGLACARDLVLLFVFFDLTAVASYFLIGFDRERREARGAALMALLVTGVSAVALLIGAVLLHAEYGTFELPVLFERAEANTTTAIAAALIAVAALAKSAQVPLHFWLPRAMAAPTPVSAYLHSAAMVAAGVLVLGRVHPLLALEETVLDGLLVVGLVSIAIGGVLALAQDTLKQILAHSTISQYGYVVALYGIGGSTGAGAAAFYVIAHAIAKSALFMTAGAVTEATGETRMSRLGGLARELPLLAVASGIAAATLAALPLTIGFFKDELFFAAAIEDGTLMQILAVLAAALTFAYIGRFWLGLFTGPRRTGARPIPVLLVAPVVLLAALAVVGGIVVGPFAELASDAATVTYGAPVEVHPAYHLDTRGGEPDGGRSVGARRADHRRRDRARPGGVRAGARRPADRAAALVRRRAGRREPAVRPHPRRRGARPADQPRGRARPGRRAGPRWPARHADRRRLPGRHRRVGRPADHRAARARGRGRGHRLARPQPAACRARALGARLRARRRLRRDRRARRGARRGARRDDPDAGVRGRVRPPPHTSQHAPSRKLRRRRLRNGAAGVIAGLSAFATIWGALSRPSLAESDAVEHIRRTPEAHGGDVVTVILADFRGFDTMVEITVLVVAVAGVAALLRHGRSW